MSNLDTFHRVLASLHRATLDADHWPAAAALIDEACGSSGNGVVVGDDAGVYFAQFIYRGERRQDLERAYFEEYHDIDEALPRLRALPEGRLAPIRSLYSGRELETSIVYNEALPRLGAQRGLEVRFDGPDGLRIVWAIADPVTAGGWQADHLALIERLVPHVRLFVRVRQALANAEGLVSGTAGLLDGSGMGVLCLDRGGRLVAANDRGAEILRYGDGLFDRGGALHARMEADDERLQKLLGQALPGFRGRAARGGSMSAGRTAGPTRLGLHVVPVGDGQGDFGGFRVAALVLVVDPAHPPHIDPGRVAEALGLPPSEGRVAALLAEGRSVGEIAAAAGWEEGYVRWLLKQIYRKQGVPGQVGLMRQVLALDVLTRR